MLPDHAGMGPGWDRGLREQRGSGVSSAGSTTDPSLYGQSQGTDRTAEPGTQVWGVGTRSWAERTAGLSAALVLAVISNPGMTGHSLPVRASGGGSQALVSILHELRPP